MQTLHTASFVQDSLHQLYKFECFYYHLYPSTLVCYLSLNVLVYFVWLYPRYEVYRGYIVFAFSVIMFVCLCVGLSVCKLFSSKISQQLLKFSTKLDSDELYCVAKTATYCLSVPLFVLFFSPMEISVTDFSAPIGASVFKFYVHLQVGKVYCVNEN